MKELFALLKTTKDGQVGHKTRYMTTERVETLIANADKAFANFGGGRVAKVKDASGDFAVCIEPDSINDIVYRVVKFFYDNEKADTPAEERLQAAVRRCFEKSTNPNQLWDKIIMPLKDWGVKITSPDGKSFVAESDEGVIITLA